MGTRVYLARLAGLPVFDPNGDRVGRVRDAVVRLRTTSRPPQVVGLVAEMALRRRIFLPISRVTSMDDESVVTRIAVREHAGRLARRGHVYQAEYGRVRGLIGPTDTQGTSNLLAVLEQMRPADLANALQDLSDARRNEVAAALSDRRLADVLEELPEHDQVEILARLDRERAADVLERMDPDDAADLLAELPKSEQMLLLDLMEPDEAAPVRQLMNYRPGTAGSVMTSEPVILTPDATVAEALARIREPDLSPVVAAQVFVARPPMSTPSGKYLGMVHFQRLLREPPSSILGGLIDSDIDPLHPNTHLTE